MTLPSAPRTPAPLPQAIRQFLASFRFRPAFVAALRDYTARTFQHDVAAGLVVGVVALPLAIAFAINSGAPPRAGLLTAALAGMLVAFLGGSRLQIAGPTGAFVPILYAITNGDLANFGDLLVATLIAGALLFLFGFFRLGTLIKFIPYPVTTGFTAGIAVIIFLQQVPHILGLKVPLPGETIGKIEVIAEHLGDANGYAVLFAVACVVVIQVIKRYAPRIPGSPIALLALTLVAVFWASQRVLSVGDLFGGIPSGAPTFDAPDLSLAHIARMFPHGLTIALLGGIESLLSAVVADGMADTRHDSNQELMGQGLANLVVPFFGGFAATGAIARTATNVQNGGRTPVAGFVHGLVVLAVLLVAAPYASLIPMAVLAGILVVVAWNMSERHRFAQLLKMPASDAGVMVATFGLTVLLDLTIAVGVGLILAAALFVGRMANLTKLNVSNPEEDMVRKQESLEGKEIPPGVAVYSIDGPFFFGAAEQFEKVLETIGTNPKVILFRMRRVPYLDATALNAFENAVKQLRKHHIDVILSAPQSQPLDMMMRSGFTKKVGDENIQPNIHAALERARKILGLPSSPAEAALAI